MFKKITKIAGITLSALALISLALPMYHATIGEGETWIATFRGFDLVELSPWGAVLLLLPLLTSGIICSTLDNKTKTILNMGLFLLGSVSIYSANFAMREWIYAEASGYVQVYGSLIIYAALILSAAILFHLHCNTKDKNSATTLLVEPIDIFDEHFSLCPHTVKFTKFGKNLEHVEFDGCISFSTDDGYFAALGHGDDEEYIDHGCIEFSDEDDTVRGFATRTMPYGLYGSFYEDCESMRWRLKILPFPEVTEGDARLLLPDGDGDFSEIPVTLNPICVTHIDCRLSEDLKTKSSIYGAVIVQHGKIAAVVSEYDKENKKYICVSSEISAADLARMVYEQKVAEKMREQ